MKSFILLLTSSIFLLLASCMPQADVESTEASSVPEPTLRNDSPVPLVSQLPVRNDTPSISVTEKSKSTQKPVQDLIEYDRMIQFPGDVHFNGKPMIQQMDLSLKIIDYKPDTLLRLAVESYLSYKDYYPVSIADDFENGISTEIIYYPPQLTFRYMLFEDCFAEEPYLVREVVVIRNSDGSLNVKQY